MSFEKNIICIGSGYVGGTTMAVIASKCPRYKVTAVDTDADRIARWNSDILPIYEPGLDEIVRAARGRNLFFSTDIEETIRGADMIFVSVSTPTKSFGEGRGMAADLQYWEKTARQIGEQAVKDTIVIEKSTFPVRTAFAMERILSTINHGLRFQILSNPEFLAEGTAIHDLEEPDRVLIGSHETPEAVAARDNLITLYEHWVPREKIITSNIWSAELSKLTANAFLAQRISSINAISAFCEQTEADVDEVARAIGMDNRIGSKFLNAGLGFGGSCFKKDILSLVYLCRSYGLDEVADYWNSVVRMNEYQKNRFVQTMLSAMFNTLAGKKITLFGFAFKANTGDTREAPAIDVARKLLSEQADITITDPKALENARADLADVLGKITFTEDPYEAAAESDAIAVITDWDLYKTLDYEQIFKSMNKPAFIFDGRNALDHRQLFEIGFNVFPIGKVPSTHF
ncbi:MAG: UDP-glucose 6-dehydrogenase [delta proteobacterium MLS_D]|jgi:UDPglucose 6-dehydrogenase|nr:MAG: UDP-glucose 6-dehydrogenase [delta proteobacterium MLS_D]